MKKNKEGFVPVIIILLVLIGFVGVYFLGTLKNKPITTNPTSSPIATIKPTTGPTANWKTYTNTKYNFNIQYPNNWIVLENPIDDPRISNDSIRLSNDTSSVYISIFEEYGGACPSGYQKIMINNQLHDVCISETGTGETAWEQITFQKAKYIIELRAYSKKSTSEELLVPQILSTFKFTN